MCCLNYFDKQNIVMSSYNVSDKKFNDLENNRFGNKLYYKKTDSQKELPVKKNFKTYSADFQLKDLEKYNLLPKRMMKKKFYAFQKKPVDKKLEEAKNEVHVNQMKQKYANEEEMLFSHKIYLDKSNSGEEEELTARERPKLMIDEAYLKKFCREIVKKEFNPDTNKYGEYQFVNRDKVKKNASTGNLNMFNQPPKTSDNFYYNNSSNNNNNNNNNNDNSNSEDKLNLKNIFNNFEQIDKRTKEKFYNTFYKYNKSVNMVKHPLKEVNVYDEKDNNIGDVLIQHGEIQNKVPLKKKSQRNLTFYESELLKQNDKKNKQLNLIQYHPGLEKTIPDGKYSLIHNPKLSYSRYKGIIVIYNYLYR